MLLKSFFLFSSAGDVHPSSSDKILLELGEKKVDIVDRVELRDEGLYVV